VLEVSRSGYYTWRDRTESRTARRQCELTDRIREIHGQKHYANYGAPRIHRELVAQGYACNRKTVEKLRCRAGIRARTCRRFRVMTTDSRHSLPIAPNRLARQFEPTERHRAWTMDITYIGTDEGWLYLAVVEDLFSRKIVGWATSERIDSELVVSALNMALEQERPQVGLLAHSDRGVQYASDRFQAQLARHGIVCSMSRKANCWDNAPTESFFATLKKELVHHEQYATRDAARRSLFEYIEVFYNRQRIHSARDYQTPDAVDRGRSREEGRGAGPAAAAVGGERGIVSPKSKNNRGEAAPQTTNHP